MSAAEFTPERIAAWRQMRMSEQMLTERFIPYRDADAEWFAALNAIEELQVRLSACQLGSIEARNPGIDLDEVRLHRKNPWDVAPVSPRGRS